MTLAVRPIYTDSLTAGFLKLTRTSETGAPGEPVYINRDKVLYMQREEWGNAFTRVWLASDCQVRVVETPEGILEALD